MSVIRSVSPTLSACTVRRVLHNPTDEGGGNVLPLVFLFLSGIQLAPATGPADATKTLERALS